MSVEAPSTSPKEEPQEPAKKERDSDYSAITDELLEAAELFVGNIDPKITVERADDSDYPYPGLRVLYDGRRLTGYIPNLTNEGGTYRPGGIHGDIESGQFQRDLTRIIEDEMQRSGLGKYKDMGKSKEQLEKERIERDARQREEAMYEAYKNREKERGK